MYNTLYLKITSTLNSQTSICISVCVCCYCVIVQMIDKADISADTHTCTRLCHEHGTDSEAKLRLRIEQQLDVICSLKCEVTGQEKDYASLRNEMEKIDCTSSQLQIRFEEEQKAKDLLNDRFEMLASNHNEMIALMKEYKKECGQLRESLSSRGLESNQANESVLRELKVESGNKSKEIESLNGRLIALEEVNSNITEREAELKISIGSLCDKEVKLKTELDRVKAESDAKVLCCENKIKEINKVKESTENKIENLKLQLLELEQSRSSTESRNVDLEQKLHSSQIEIENLREKLIESDGERRTVENRFKLEAEKVNKDLQVIHLREELNKVEQDLSSLNSRHQSYKQYTNELLSQEREISKKLSATLP